jgi:hypothetical protein
MNDNNSPWPWLDFTTHHKNRRAFPPEKLLRYAGKHVAWNWEGTRILASGKTIARVFDQLEAAGIDCGQVVFSYVDSGDESSFPSIWDSATGGFE